MKRTLFISIIIFTFLGCKKDNSESFEFDYKINYIVGKSYTQTFYYDGQSGSVISCTNYNIQYRYKSINNRLNFEHYDYEDYFVTIAPTKASIDYLDNLNKDTKNTEHKYYLIANISFLYRGVCDAIKEIEGFENYDCSEYINIGYAYNPIIKNNWKIAVGKMEEYVFDGKIYERLDIAEIIDINLDGKKNEKQQKAITIYDIFPNYSKYDYIDYYVDEINYDYREWLTIENIIAKKTERFPIKEAVSKLMNDNKQYKIPNDAPYLFDSNYGILRSITKCELCYKEVLDKYPNYLYYEYLYIIKRLYELEHITTKERKQFIRSDAERLLSNNIIINPNIEWKIPENAPYKNLSFNYMLNQCLAIIFN